MDLDIEKLLKKRNIHIEYANVDFVAKLFETPKGPVVIVSRNFMEDYLDWAAMHEVGHSKYDCTVPGSYRDNCAVHSKMEHNANEYMVREMFSKYLALGEEDLEDVNPVHFLEQRGLDVKLEPILKKIIMQRLKRRAS